MPSEGDPTDPKGTKRPKEDPLTEEYHTFHPLVVPPRHRKLNFPPNVQPNDAYALFSLFFSDDILNIIARNTNTFAYVRESRLEQEKPNRKRKKKPWQHTSICELKAYLGVFIYESICHQQRRRTYWNRDPNQPRHEVISAHISRDRFDELETSLHTSDPEIGGNCFVKVSPYLHHTIGPSPYPYHMSGFRPNF